MLSFRKRLNILQRSLEKRIELWKARKKIKRVVKKKARVRKKIIRKKKIKEFKFKVKKKIQKVKDLNYDIRKGIVKAKISRAGIFIPLKLKCFNKSSFLKSRIKTIQ